MSKSTKGTPGKQTNLFSFFNKVTIPKSDNNNNTTSTSTTNNNNNNKEKDNQSNEINLKTVLPSTLLNEQDQLENANEVSEFHNSQISPDSTIIQIDNFVEKYLELIPEKYTFSHQQRIHQYQQDKLWIQRVGGDLKDNDDFMINC
mmetsp:Transcript_7886/g.8366  ORF Transcript_7886/g.8366 Transcript_7886/m.8366 type:complete len:146 (+) Transcript_7886:21-458(+)